MDGGRSNRGNMEIVAYIQRGIRDTLRRWIWWYRHRNIFEEVLTMNRKISPVAQPAAVFLFVLIGIVSIALVACGGNKDPKPVNLVKGDKCVSCGATIADHSAFASEIIGVDGNVYRFDDFKCLESFMRKSDAPKSAAVFVKDYDTRTWIPFDQATVVRTGIATPNRSGKVAFKDSTRAKEFAEKNKAL